MIAYSGKQLSVAAALCWLTLTGSSALAQGGTGGSPPDEAKPAEVARPANDLHTFNVRDFGAAGDGKINDTSAITEAIQAANQSGGGEVSFPSGTYITGTFDLLSNVTLNLQVGAVLMGSGDVADYGSLAERGFDHNYGVSSSGESERVGMIVARGVHNMALWGRV